MLFWCPVFRRLSVCDCLGGVGGWGGGGRLHSTAGYVGETDILLSWTAHSDIGFVRAGVLMKK